MNILFIINEHAGNGKGRKVWKALAPQLTFHYDYEITHYAGHAVELARSAAADDADQGLLIIAVGGDGTLHEVIHGISGRNNVTVGALKAGSGNDFARGYLFFQGADELNHYINAFCKSGNEKKRSKRNRRQPMDLGQLWLSESRNLRNTRTQTAASGQLTMAKRNKSSKKRITPVEKTAPFVNNAGIGFDALVTTTVNRSRLKSVLNKVKLGGLTYALTVVWALFSFRRFNVTVTQGARSQTFRKVWFIAMCNQPYFGGGMKISPQSVPSDGRLEVTIVHNLAHWKLLLVFLTVFWGGHTRFKEVSVLKGTHFVFQTDRDMVCHTDGEYWGEMRKNERLECSVARKMWYNIDLA